MFSDEAISVLRREISNISADFHCEDEDYAYCLAETVIDGDRLTMIGEPDIATEVKLAIHNVGYPEVIQEIAKLV